METPSPQLRAIVGVFRLVNVHEGLLRQCSLEFSFLRAEIKKTLTTLIRFLTMVNTHWLFATPRNRKEMA
jgi:hypothetical protein